MAAPLLISPIFMEFILPFVFVFTLIFAILEKSQLLGEGKKQINAMLGLVVGLVLIAFPFARNIIVTLLPFLAVTAVILLVFMLLYGFAGGKKEGDVLDKKLKIAFGILIGIGLVIVLLYATGLLGPVWNYFYYSGDGSVIFINVLLIAVIIGAVISVVRDKGSGKSSG
jgi:hypothetical protein